MAVTIRTMDVARVQSGKTFFAVNAFTTDGQGAEVILAAPGDGKSIYLEQVTIHGDFDGYLDFGDGESGSAVETVAFVVVVTTQGGCSPLRFAHPIKLTTNKACTFDCSASGNTSVLIEGYII